jgi:hypothetical protein
MAIGLVVRAGVFKRLEPIRKLFRFLGSIPSSAIKTTAFVWFLDLASQERRLFFPAVMFASVIAALAAAMGYTDVAHYPEGKLGGRRPSGERPTISQML